jgi:phage baseplate assembly protein W
MSEDRFQRFLREFKDLNIGFKKNPITKDLLVQKNEQAVSQSVQNLLQTRFGEKLMDPEVGSRVYEILFEPLDGFSAAQLQETIINTIRNYEPRVEIIDCIVSAEDSDSSEVRVDIEYRIVGDTITINSTFILQRPGD